MRYVKKPVPVEAVFVNSIGTALGFLNPGEYPVVNTDSLLINTPAGILKVRVGEHYLLRGPNGDVRPIKKDRFEDDYLPFDAVSASFEAHHNDDGTYSVECTECGPIGVTADETTLADIGFAHITEQHMETR